MKHGTADHLTALSSARSGGEGIAGLGVEARAPGLVLTRAELAAVLRVSVRTVGRMVTTGDLPVMELGEDLVRFYLPDVLEALRSGKRKFGRRAGQSNIQHSTFNTQHPTEGESHKGANRTTDHRTTDQETPTTGEQNQ